MKNILVLCLTLFSVIGKSQPYIPIPLGHCEWKYHTVGMGYIDVTHITSLDTTQYIIGSQAYYKLIRDGVQTYYVRQDTAARKVYWYQLPDSVEVLLYDFSLNIGDTLYCTLGELDYIILDSIIIGAEGNKYYVFDEASYMNYQEYVGNSIDFFYNYCSSIAFDPAPWLSCFIVNDSIVIGNDSICSLIDGINEYVTDAFTVYYDNTIQALRITAHRGISTVDKLILMDLKGTILHTIDNVNDNEVIDLSQYSAGTYIIKAISSDMAWSTKFIKYL